MGTICPILKIPSCKASPESLVTSSSIPLSHSLGDEERIEGVILLSLCCPFYALLWGEFIRIVYDPASALGGY